MALINDLKVKLKIFRRRHKFSLILSIIIFFSIIGFIISQDYNINFGKQQNSNKTIPFFKTPAAGSLEFDKLVPSGDNANTKQSDQDKIKLADSIIISDDALKLKHDFFYKIFDIILDAKPKVEKLDRYLNEERIYHAGYEVNPMDDNSPIFSEDYLLKFLQLTEKEVGSMKVSHSKVVDLLPDSYPKNFYKGNGIVYVGGGKFNWLALLSIKSLRSVGSELPVEVIIPTIEEFETDLCGRVFPALNAKCILLPKILGEKINKQFSFRGYQFKSLALIASSFENVLLLDSDNVPVHPPDYLFNSEPFISTGLISWPDFWKRATSPYYYDIADLKISKERVRYGYNNYGDYLNGINNKKQHDHHDDIKKIPLHDRSGSIPDPTSESGQLMISKKTHSKAMFLALYYNIYGPTHYYPLFSQGSDGEGDKETFIAASVVLNKPFYQVNKFLNAFGYFDLNHNFVGTGMGQYDPVEDYKILQHKTQKTDIAAAPKDIATLVEQGPRILFVHANFPKLNPWELKKTGKITDANGNRLRLYGTGMNKRCGYDFETVQWNNMFFLICKLKIDVDTFKSVERDALCGEINEHLNFLQSTIDDLEK